MELPSLAQEQLLYATRMNMTLSIDEKGTRHLHTFFDTGFRFKFIAKEGSSEWIVMDRIVPLGGGSKVITEGDWVMQTFADFEWLRDSHVETWIKVCFMETE